MCFSERCNRGYCTLTSEKKQKQRPHRGCVHRLRLGDSILWGRRKPQIDQFHQQNIRWKHLMCDRPKPMLMQKQGRAQTLHKTLHVWGCSCSTGRLTLRLGAAMKHHKPIDCISFWWLKTIPKLLLNQPCQIIFGNMFKTTNQVIPMIGVSDFNQPENSID